MPKYRLLTDEELIHFDEDFKQFLIVNQIYATEWLTMNQEDPQKAIEIVSLFSDQIMQRVYEKIAYVEKREVNSCFVFHFKADQLELIALQLKESAPDNVSLLTVASVHDAMLNHPNLIEYFRHHKAYKNTREEELHQLFEQGAELSSSEFWESLEKAL